METRKFITVFTSARHLSLSWASSIQFIPPHPTSWRSILILSSHLRLCFVSTGSISPCEYFFKMFFFFHGEALLALRPTPKLEDHPSSAVRDCLFNILAATLHIGGRSSIRNLRKRHAVVTGTHLSRDTRTQTAVDNTHWRDTHSSTLTTPPTAVVYVHVTYKLLTLYKKLKMFYIFRTRR